MQNFWKTGAIVALLAMAIPASSQSTNTGCGRYQIYFSPILREDTFMIDTNTGDIWKQVKDKVGGSVWEIMRRIDQ